MRTRDVTSGLRHMLCGVIACAVFVVSAAAASGGNDDASRCNAPGFHYGFDCADLAPSPPPPPGDPAPPPQPSTDPPPSGPGLDLLPTRGVSGSDGGGLHALMA
jgi:hypothetical protein